MPDSPNELKSLIVYFLEEPNLLADVIPIFDFCDLLIFYYFFVNLFCVSANLNLLFISSKFFVTFCSLCFHFICSSSVICKLYSKVSSVSNLLWNIRVSNILLLLIFSKSRESSMKSSINGLSLELGERSCEINAPAGKSR